LYNERELQEIAATFGYSGTKQQIIRVIDNALKTIYNG
jgi:hypothetical protein